MLRISLLSSLKHFIYGTYLVEYEFAVAFGDLEHDFVPLVAAAWLKEHRRALLVHCALVARGRRQLDLPV